MTEREFLAKAARRYKVFKLRGEQRYLGSGIMDDVAVALNSEPTYEEERFVKRMWEIFFGAWGNVS